jgi:hypothetical protein
VVTIPRQQLLPDKSAIPCPNNHIGKRDRENVEEFTSRIIR